MLSLLRSQGRCLDLGFAGGEGDLAFCWVGLANSEIAQILQHRVSKLLSELREPPDLVHSCPARQRPFSHALGHGRGLSHPALLVIGKHIMVDVR